MFQLSTETEPAQEIRLNSTLIVPTTTEVIETNEMTTPIPSKKSISPFSSTIPPTSNYLSTSSRPFKGAQIESNNDYEYDDEYLTTDGKEIQGCDKLTIFHYI